MIEQRLVYPDGEGEEPSKTMREVKFQVVGQAAHFPEVLASRILYRKKESPSELIGLRI